ncbi:MAG TPA: hypothetical protein ENN55_03770, partial [Firmicutes bacterium]|nr:hypothetical protein [Bacillota bacterium]
MKRAVLAIVLMSAAVNLFAIGIGYNNEGPAIRHWWNAKTFFEFSVSWEGDSGAEGGEFAKKNYLKYTIAPVYY